MQLASADDAIVQKPRHRRSRRSRSVALRQKTSGSFIGSAISGQCAAHSISYISPRPTQNIPRTLSLRACSSFPANRSKVFFGLGQGGETRPPPLAEPRHAQIRWQAEPARYSAATATAFAARTTRRLVVRCLLLVGYAALLQAGQLHASGRQASLQDLAFSLAVF
jgi:VanZ family protein